MYLYLNQVKKHLNIEDEFKDDELYILDLITVAEESISKHIDIALENLTGEGGLLPSPIVHAMLLLIGNLYANREPVSYGTVVKVPLSYEYLLGFYKNYNTI